MSTLDYKGPEKAKETPLTRCPKCGGVKRGIACPNCTAQRRDKIGGKALYWVGLAALVIGASVLTVIAGPVGLFAWFILLVYAIIGTVKGSK